MKSLSPQITGELFPFLGISSFHEIFFPEAASHSVGYPFPPADPRLSCPRNEGQFVLSGADAFSFLFSSFFDKPGAFPEMSGSSERRKKDETTAAVKMKAAAERRYLLYFPLLIAESGFVSRTTGLSFSF